MSQQKYDTGIQSQQSYNKSQQVEDSNEQEAENKQQEPQRGTTEDLQQQNKGSSITDIINRLLGTQFGQGPDYRNLSSPDLEGVADYIKQGKAKHIIVMCGAGISTAAGIPDFRSDKGIYNIARRYGMSSPEELFEINSFKQNPQPFFQLAKELIPHEYQPTLTHYFLALLNQKNLLHRCWTQNIDSLEIKAGLAKDKLLACHGNLDGAHCTSCKRSVTVQEMEKHLRSGETCVCKSCGGYAKPDVIFFNEGLPFRFYRLLPFDFAMCDLLIVMGTSLVVQPFASLADQVKGNCPRILINREPAGGFTQRTHSKRDAMYLGDCDEGALKLCQLLGWENDLKKLQNAQTQQ